MRQLKFRAWDTTNKKMHLDELETFEFARNGEPVLCGVGGFSKPLQAKTSVSDGQLILMQYTGLKDRNGKEIYEGDILTITTKDRAEEADEYNWTWISPIMAVKYCFGGWRLYIPHKKMNFPMLFETPSLVLEVIGNVWENPELIKEESE